MNKGVVIGWYKIHGMILNPTSAGISSKVLKILEKEPLALEAGERIAEKIAKKIIKCFFAIA